MYSFLLSFLYVVYVSGGGVNADELGILSDCIGCKNEQPELKEFLKLQKIAHRLEYIKQQLISNLHVENPPKKPPKLDALPNFLLNKLVNPIINKENEDGYSPEPANDELSFKQIILFAEQGEKMLIFRICFIIVRIIEKAIAAATVRAHSKIPPQSIQIPLPSRYTNLHVWLASL